MWEAIAVIAGGKILEGIFAKDQYSSSAAAAAANAEAVAQAAEINAQIYRDWGNYNAEVYQAVGEANAAAIEKVAEQNAQAAEEFADYNAEIIELVADYNAKLNENEARYVLDAAEIKVDQTDKTIRQILGKNRAYYAGAGVQVNTGSPVDAEIDVRTQGDIDIAIIRRGAEIEAARFHDAAAMAEWQGETDATLTRYQGALQGWQYRTQGALQATQIRTDAINRANMSRYEGQINSIMTLVNGQQQANLHYQQSQIYDQQASQAIGAGIINAATTAATAYLGYEWMQAGDAGAGVGKSVTTPKKTYTGFPMRREALILPQSDPIQNYSPFSDWRDSFESKWGLLN